MKELDRQILACDLILAVTRLRQKGSAATEEDYRWVEKAKQAIRDLEDRAITEMIVDVARQEVADGMFFDNWEHKPSPPLGPLRRLD